MTLFLKIPIKYYYLEKCNNPQEDWVFFFELKHKWHEYTCRNIYIHICRDKSRPIYLQIKHSQFLNREKVN